MLRLAHDSARRCATKPATHVFVFRSTLVPGHGRGRAAADHRARIGQEGRRRISTSASSRSSCARARRSATTTSRRSRSSARTRRSRRRSCASSSGICPASSYATSIRAAEMVKYSCNNFHALKITFANETARLCEALGVDPFEVMDLVCKDRQLNISPAYLKPGFAFGGSCLPKDLRATMHLAKTRDVELPMHGGDRCRPTGCTSSTRSPRCIATGKRRIGMIGLSFKTGTDDLRESPLVLLAEHFIGKGFAMLVYDPEVHLSQPARREPALHRAASCRTSASLHPRRHRGGDRGVRRAGRRPRRSGVVAALAKHARARADDSRSDQDDRSHGVARTLRGIVLVNPGVLIIANVIALAIALAWLAHLTLPYAQAVRVRNAFLLRRGRAEDFSWTPTEVPDDFRSEQMLAPNAIRGAVESAGVAKLAGDWPRALVLVQMLVQHSQHEGGIRRTRNDFPGHRRGRRLLRGLCSGHISPLRAARVFFAVSGPSRSTGSAATATRSSRCTIRERQCWRFSTSTTTSTAVLAGTDAPIDALELRRALIGDPATIGFRRAGPGRLGFPTSTSY